MEVKTSEKVTKSPESLMAKDDNAPKRLYLRPLAPYEDRLLTSLAFFRTHRRPTTQAHHCLSMYLRQSESRILSEVDFYARRCGMDKWELMELIYTNPDKAQEAIEKAIGVKPDEVFDEEPDPDAPDRGK